MAHLLVVILHQTSQLPRLLDAWHAIDVPGITILDSAGGHRTHHWLQQVGLGAISELFSSDDVRGKTLLLVIDDEDLLEQAIIEAEQIIGDFYQPGSGLLFVMPVSRVVGIYRPKPKDEEAGKPPVTPVREALTGADLNARETTVTVIHRVLNLEPVIVEANLPLLEVAEVMISHPNVHVACVVNEQQRLIGLLSLRNLADDLLMTVFPEEFLSEAHDLEDALHFAHLSRTQSAADAMIPAVWVKEEDLLKDAFQKMHDHQLSGIPIIDDRYQVTGYINLLELLATYARSQQRYDQENQADE